MRIVKFRDGKYGIRRGIWPFYAFKDLKDNPYWWERGALFFSCCKSDDLDHVRKIMHHNCDNGRVIE